MPLHHLPLALFAAPLGLGGLGLAWREASRGLGAPGWIGETILALAAALWLAVAALHLLRHARHPEALAADLGHPVRAAFAGAATIALMVMAGALTPHWERGAGALWLLAVLGHLAIAAWTLRGLLLAPKDAAALTPPILLPLVGNIVAPIFGPALGFATLSVMLFGVGAALWLMLQPLLLGRLIHGPALPAKLRPTLVIFLAPPALGALALASLAGGFGPLPLALLGFAAFVALVLMTLLAEFIRTPFALSWWSWTFPVAGFVTAVQAACRAHPAGWQPPVEWALLLALTAIVALVAAATVRALLSGELLRPEA